MSQAGRLGRLTLGVGLAVTALMVLAQLWQPLPVERLRAVIFDSYARAGPAPPAEPDLPVALVLIDEAALAAHGQWPWSRLLIAEMTHRLADLGAVAVGYDILFAEPDRFAPEALGRLGLAPGDLPDPDAALAAAMTRLPVVLAVAGAPEGRAPPDLPAGISHTGQHPGAALLRFPSLIQPIDPLREKAAGLGLISTAPGADGVTRSLPMLGSVGDVLVPSLVAELLRTAQGAGGHVLRTSEASGLVSGGQAQAVALRSGAVEIPLQADGQMRLRPGTRMLERALSAEALLRGETVAPDLAAAVAGRIVLVGAGASGLMDMAVTPLGETVPGVVLHAEALGQILAGDFLSRPDWADGLELALIVLAGLVVTLGLRARSARVGLALGAGVVVVFLGGSVWAYLARGLLLDPGLPVLTALGVYLPGLSLGYLATERARRAVEARFANFLPPDLIARIAADPERILTPGGAERELSVMFVDMRNFTGVTETLAPAEVVEMVNGFLTSVTEALVEEGATIDKFMGDAVMAFWNAPIEMPDHRARALAGLRAVERAVDAANAARRQAGTAPLGIGIGVNTGTAFVGLMGSRARLSYTCIGDSVTLAARLEGLTRGYGVTNCIGPETLAEGVPEGMVAVELDRVAVKGRQAAVPVFSLLEGDGLAEFTAAFEAARAAYLARDWDAAEAGFRALGAMQVAGCDTGVLAANYIARIDAYREVPPPPDWDGVFRATAKR